MEMLCYGNGDYQSEAVHQKWEERYQNFPVESYPDRDGLISGLKQLLERPQSGNEWQKPATIYMLYHENETTRYLANPLTLALLLEEYQLAEALVDRRYGEWFRDDPQFISQKSMFHWEYQEIFCTQFLVARTDMPETLFVKLCRDCDEQIGTISLWEDFLMNPFLERPVKWEEKNKEIPDFQQIDRIYRYNPQLFRWGMYGKMRGYIGEYGCLPTFSPKRTEMFLNQLIKYVIDFEDSIIQLLFVQKDQVSSIYTDGEGYQYFKVWLKQLWRLQERCKESECLQKTMFRHLIHCAYKQQSRKKKDHHARYSETMNQLSELIALTMPENYEFADYLKEIIDIVIRERESYSEYIRYLNVWKYCIRKPMKLRRTNKDYWYIVNAIAGDVMEELEDDPFHFNRERDRLNEKELRLSTLIDFFEFPIEFPPVKKISRAMNEQILDLFLILMDFGSEELAITCMKRNFVLVNQIPQYIDIAIEQKQLKLVPVMIAYQNMQKEERKHV